MDNIHHPPPASLQANPSPSFAYPTPPAPQSRTCAMPIPGSHTKNVPSPPPPLPPPRYPFGQPPSFQDSRVSYDDSSPSSLHPGSSLNEPSCLERFATMGSHLRDEGYASVSSYSAPPPVSQYRLSAPSDANSSLPPTSFSPRTSAQFSSHSSHRTMDSLPSLPSIDSAGFGLHHNRYQFGLADAYSNSLKEKLNPKRTLGKAFGCPSTASSASYAPYSPNETSRFADSHPHPQPPSLSLSSVSYHHYGQSPTQESPDSAYPYAPTPLNSAVSPSTGSSALPPIHLYPHRETVQSPIDNTENIPSSYLGHVYGDEIEAMRYGGRSYEDNSGGDFEETHRLKRLHLDDPMRSRIKRRASSPLGVPLADATSFHENHRPPSTDLYAYRDPRRLDKIPQGSLPRAATFSGYSHASALSGDRYDECSPGGISPQVVSLADDKRGNLFAASTHVWRHNRSGSDYYTSPRKIMEPKPRPIESRDGFMCECCPKKPKKFNNWKELHAHEAEKQYECNFCGNRFKNKNEAERHQNSLHLRRHSWSCKALASFDRAFHESHARPGEADTCGYCGEDFARTGPVVQGASVREASKRDWEERARHLQGVHKFRECNNSKKFYRADHFRQHLKHSHAGVSGKWTNVLENACMQEEEPLRR